MSAATQRFNLGFDREWIPTYEHFARINVTNRRQRIEIADTGSAGSLNTVSHSIGRSPTGVLIINAVASGGVSWYRATTDADWTDSTINLRFNVANARVLLEVF